MFPSVLLHRFADLYALYVFVPTFFSFWSDLVPGSRVRCVFSGHLLLEPYCSSDLRFIFDDYAYFMYNFFFNFLVYIYHYISNEQQASMHFCNCFWFWLFYQNWSFVSLIYVSCRYTQFLIGKYLKYLRKFRFIDFKSVLIVVFYVLAMQPGFHPGSNFWKKNIWLGSLISSSFVIIYFR